MSNIGLKLLLCFGVFIVKTDALYMYGFQSCAFSSDGYNTVLTGQLYYNKQLIASYNSTEGKFTGYTDTTKEIIDGLNKNQRVLNEMKKGLNVCKQGVPDIVKALEGSVQKPQVRVFSTKTASIHTSGILTCVAYNFYPKPITLTWLRNGEEVTSDVISTDEMSNGNWLYQKHSYLEYTPAITDTIQCMVEHVSLPTPEIHKWVYFTESRKNKISVGTAGLILGLAFAAVGLIYYMKHTRVHVLEPQY